MTIEKEKTEIKRLRELARSKGFKLRKRRVRGFIGVGQVGYAEVFRSDEMVDLFDVIPLDGKRALISVSLDWVERILDIAERVL
jgi:hypothetical protein